jgi:CBS domain-containing protein
MYRNVTDVEYVRPDDTAREAAIKMQELNAGLLPASDQGRVAGVVTDREIAVRAVAKGLDPRSTPVRNLMYGGIIKG